VPDEDDLTVRSPERTVTLTDAVVAIAMTLLVLPLTELVPDVEPDRLVPWIGEHRDVFIGFVVSFLVIYVFWGAHSATFARIERMTPALRRLNMFWLLGVAFLPFPTALVGRHATTSTVPFYLGTLTVVSLLTNGMAVQAWRTSGSVAAAQRTRWSLSRAHSLWITPLVLGACALLGAGHPAAGLYGVLALVPARVVEGWLRR